MAILPAILVTLFVVVCCTSAEDMSMMSYMYMESPKNTSVSSIRFLFFNHSNLGEAPIAVRRPSEVTTNFDPKFDTIVIVHGFADYYPGSYLIPALVKGYSTFGKKNMIAVDWGDMAAAPWYLSAARNTYSVGQVLANFLNGMIKERRLTMDTLEIVGFSLGAHVAGVAASFLTSQPRRIIGLDPAELLFAESPVEYILDQTDAPLVEIIHTSGGFIGFKRPLGHRDFYPNGGSHPQPGCDGNLAATCSHRRSYQYFAEALMKKGSGFMATKCSSMNIYKAGRCKHGLKLSIVNNNYNSTLRGLFYLITNPKKPFARKQM